MVSLASSRGSDRRARPTSSAVPRPSRRRGRRWRRVAHRTWGRRPCAARCLACAAARTVLATVSCACQWALCACVDMILPPPVATASLCTSAGVPAPPRLVHRQPPSRVPRCPLTGYGRGLRDGAGRRRDPSVKQRVDTHHQRAPRLAPCHPPHGVSSSCAPPSGRRWPAAVPAPPPAEVPRSRPRPGTAAGVCPPLAPSQLRLPLRARQHEALRAAS